VSVHTSFAVFVADCRFELVEELREQGGRELRAQALVLSRGDLPWAPEHFFAGGRERGALDAPVAGLAPAADESAGFERVEVMGQGGAADAHRLGDPGVPHCLERTSTSTCQAEAEPPASAIARSNACVTTQLRELHWPQRSIQAADRRWAVCDGARPHGARAWTYHLGAEGHRLFSRRDHRPARRVHPARGLRLRARAPRAPAQRLGARRPPRTRTHPAHLARRDTPRTAGQGPTGATTPPRRLVRRGPTRPTRTPCVTRRHARGRRSIKPGGVGQPATRVHAGPGPQSRHLGVRGVRCGCRQTARLKGLGTGMGQIRGGSAWSEQRGTRVPG
jgi:hypothetical protein